MPVEVHLNPELTAKLSRAAGEPGRSAEALVEEAVERFLDYDEWFAAEVEEGVAAAEAGDFVEHADVRKLIETRYRG